MFKLCDSDKIILLNLISNHKPNIVAAKIIRSHQYIDLKSKIINYQNDRYLGTLSEALYWIYHNLECKPLCIYCNTLTTDFISFKDGYKKHCIQCRRYSFKKSLIKTYQKKYGVDHYMQLDSNKDKLKDSMNDKYSVDNAMQLSSSKKKAQDTSLIRYGFSHAMKNDDIKNKLKDSMNEKYGVDNAMFKEEFKEKSQITCQLKYGVPFASQNDDIKEQTQKTCYLKYGFNCSSKNQQVKDKAIQTSLIKYGTEYPIQNEKIAQKIHDIKYNNNKIKYTQLLIKMCKENNYTLLNEYDTSWDKISIECNQCHRKWETYYYSLATGGGTCPNCSSSQSIPENQIGNFLLDHNINFKQNDRTLIKPLEIDLLIDDKKLAVEFCGLWWHCDKMISDNNYHVNKLNKVNDKGYKLITIFEDEWVLHQDIVRSKLLYLNGIHDNFEKIRASACDIVVLSQEEKKDFFNNNHLQNDRSSKINIGLKYKDKIVSAASFNGYKELNNYELIRFCSLTDTIVYGGMSKILQYFESIYKPKILWSFCDRRWSEGNIYKQMGFELDSISQPNYWYWGKNIIGRSHRLNYSKKMLTNMKYYDKKLTEFQIMNLNGYRRIYDCGNFKFKKAYQ